MTQRIIYQNEHPYFITSNTYYRRHYFKNYERANLFYDIILQKCKIFECRVLSFCIMPDHVHLLLRPNGQNKISKIMQQIKSSFVYELRIKYGLHIKFWQPRYNYRIVDSEERFINTLNYIKGNHIKGGLPRQFGRQPFLYFNHRDVDAVLR